jgi:Tfp pilus assembly protein PilN
MYVSLNIGSRAIKVLSLSGGQVKKWGNLALKDGLVKDGLVLEPRAVGEAIGALFKATGIPRERVVAGLAGLSFTYRFLKLPRLKSSLQEEAVLRAAGREMSLPLDDLYLAWQALPGPGEEQSFFVLGVPRNLVDAVLQTLDAAGVPPYLMDLRPLALARAAARTDAIVVNLDIDCFDIVFIAGGIPRVVHSFSPRRGEATLEDNVRQVIDELGKMAAFYQGSRPQVPLSAATPLLLSGDLAGDSPAGALLQSEVDYPVEPMVPRVSYPPGFPAASYAASVGLALKKAPPPKTERRQTVRFYDLNVNILSGRRRRARTRRLPAAYVPLGAMLAIALVLLFPLYQAGARLTGENAALQEDLRVSDRELSLASLAAEETARTGAAIQAITDNTSARRAANRDILGARGEFSDVLGAVTAALPPGAIFVSIECDALRVAITGRTSSVFTAVAYAAALEATGRFSDVRITRLDEGDPAPTADNASLPSSGPVIFEVLLAR